MRRGPQARGVARREQLLAAATTLLGERELDEISLADVAGLAGMPVASAYTLYPNINAVFAQLMIDFTRQMTAEIDAGINAVDSRNWLEIVGHICDRFVAFFARHRAYERIRLSGKATAEVRYSEERVRGVDFAPRFRALIEREYVMPALADGDRPFLIMLDIVDGIFTSEFIREGRLNEAIADEAKRAAFAYLKLYIPEYLPRRSQAGGTTDTMDNDPEGTR